MVKLNKNIMICLSRSKKMPPKRHNTTKHPTVNISGGSAHPPKNSGDKSAGFLSIPCRTENKEGDCKDSSCFYNHTKKPNISIEEGNKLRAVARPQLPKFENHQRVSDPRKELFGEFMNSQMDFFHRILSRDLPEFFRGLLLSNGFFEKIVYSFASAKNYETFLEFLTTFEISIETLRKFIVDNLKIINLTMEVSSSDDEDISSDATKVPTLLSNLRSLIFSFLRKSVPVEEIKQLLVKDLKPAGTYNSVSQQLFTLGERLKTFIQSVEQSWDELNRPVLKIEVSHVSSVEKSVQAVHDVNNLKAILEFEKTKIANSTDEDHKKLIAVIQIWLDMIRRLSALALPSEVIFSKELLTQIFQTVPAVKEHIESVVAFKKTLKQKSELDSLRSLNLTTLCGGKVQQVNASDVVSACCIALSVLKGRHETIFSQWTKKLSKQSQDSIYERFGDFFNLLQAEFLRMLSKGKYKPFFDSMQKEQELSTKYEHNLVEILMKVEVQFDENVSSSQDKVLRTLTEVSKNRKNLEELFNLLFLVLPTKARSPIPNFKFVDYLIKSLKMVFGDNLKLLITPTGVKFSLTYGLEKGQEAVDVQEIVAIFLVRMLLLNNTLLHKGLPVFSKNLQFERSKNVMIEDEETIAKALLDTLATITGNTTSHFAEVFSSKNDTRSGFNPQSNVESAIKSRFERFLNRLFESCVSQNFNRDVSKQVVGSLNTEASTLFSKLNSNGLTELMISILTSAYKPSKSTSMMKMISQGILLLSPENNDALRELSSFVATPSVDELNESSFPFRSDIFELIQNMLVSNKDNTIVLKEFYESLWRVLRFILSNLSPIDMTRVYSLYTSLELFNATSGEHTFRHCFPYTTHFFCTLLVALQNSGLSLGDALKLFSKSITSTKLNQTFAGKDLLQGWLSKAENTATTVFSSKKASYDRANSSRTKLSDDTPLLIKIVLKNLLSQSVSSVSEELRKDLERTILCLFAQDVICERPNRLTFLNTMFSFVCMTLSSKSVDFLKLYNVDATGLQVGSGNDGDCYHACLRTMLPHLRTVVTQTMCDTMRAMKDADKLCKESSSELSDSDLRYRFNRVKIEVVLELFKTTVADMGIVPMSSIMSIQEINKVIQHISRQQTDVDETFLNDLKDSIFRFAQSYREAGNEQFRFRQFRRKLWEERQAAQAAAQAANDSDDEVDSETLPEPDQALVVLSSKVVSSKDILELMDTHIKDLFSSYPPTLICGAGCILIVLHAILSIKNDNARDARYSELCRAFPVFFHTVFLQSIFEVEFDDSKVTQDFVNALEKNFAENYSSKMKVCMMLELEPSDDINSYLDACFREFRDEVQTFLMTQPTLTTDIRLPDLFPDSTESDDEAESDDDDEAEYDEAESDEAQSDDDEAESDDDEAQSDDDESDEAQSDDDEAESDDDEASSECKTCKQLGETCTLCSN